MFLTLKPYLAMILAATEPPNARPYLSPDTEAAGDRELSLGDMGS